MNGKVHVIEGSGSSAALTEELVEAIKELIYDRAADKGVALSIAIGVLEIAKLELFQDHLTNNGE